MFRVPPKARLLAWICCGPLLSQSGDWAISDTVYPVDGVTVHDGVRWITCRVVDGLTGAPLPQSELVLVHEHESPLRGAWWQRAAFPADVDGFVRARADAVPRWDWVAIRAPGYGTVMFGSSPTASVVPLMPALDVPVRVVDDLDRPLPDVLVGFCSGCGHTPDLASGRTDEDGLVLLRGVDVHNGIADLYAEGAGLGLGYEGLHWLPGEPAALFRPGRARSVAGMVVDADGRPAPGAYVGIVDVHRGPWARAGEDGRFTLHGYVAGFELNVRSGDRDVVFDPPLADRVRLVLPEDEDANEPQFVTGDPSLAGAPRPVGEAPGQRETVSVEVELRALDIGQTGGHAVLLERGSGFESITKQLRHTGRVDLPRGQDARFLLEGVGTRRRQVVVPAEQLEQGSCVLSWFPPSRLQFVCVDGQGREVQVRAVAVAVYGSVAGFDPQDPGADEEVLDACEGRGQLTLDVAAVGTVLLTLLPLSQGLWPQVLPVVVPEPGEDVSVDLGRIRMDRLPLELQSGDGSTELRQAQLVRLGWSDLREGGAAFPVQQGRWLGPKVRPGDALLMPGEDAEVEPRLVRDVAVRICIQDPVPARVVLPDGQLLVDIRDEAGNPVDATVVFGEFCESVSSTVLLRRVVPGVTRVFVAAEGYRSAVADIEVPAGGRAVAQVVLPER